MSDVINLSDMPEPKTFGPIAVFRAIVPQGTTTEAPKLQQAWREYKTGEIVWKSVERVVVSNAEFFAA